MSGASQRWDRWADRITAFIDRHAVDQFQLLLVVHGGSEGLGVLLGLFALMALEASPTMAPEALWPTVWISIVVVVLDFAFFLPLARRLRRTAKAALISFFICAWIILTQSHGAYVAHQLGTTDSSWLLLLPAGAVATTAILGAGYGLLTLAVSIVLSVSVVALEALRLLPFAPANPQADPEIYLAPWPIIRSLSLVILFGGFMWFGVSLVSDLLRRTRERLLQAESMASLGVLVSGASHELQNPLGSSGALLQSLREELSDKNALADEERRREILGLLDRALQGQQRASLIVDRLYRLTEDLESRGSHTLLGDYLARLRERYPTLQIRLEDEAAGKLVLESLLRNVVPNLVDNALASGSSEPPQLAVHLDERMLEILVSDSGRGISAAHQKDVFKPFFTGQKAGEGHGVGLGLYIVHELVRRLDGTVELESAESQGTRIRVRVPTEAVA